MDFKVGKSEITRDIYLRIALILITMAITLTGILLILLNHYEEEFFSIVYYIFIGLLILLAIPNLICAIYISLQPKVILYIDETNKELWLNYRKNESRKILITDIEKIKIKQGLVFMKNLMSSTIYFYVSNNPKPFKIHFAYPPLLIKNNVLELKNEKND